MTARIGYGGGQWAVLVTLLAGLLWPAPSRGGDDRGVRLSGHLKGYFFQQVPDPWLSDRVGVRLQLGVSGSSGNFSMYGAVNADVDSRLLADEPERRSAGAEVYPVEAWVEYGGDSFDLRLGLQYVFWGRTDWINPTDLFTPWDYPDMAAELEDYRLAQPALRLKWYPLDELVVDLVWQPLFRPHRLGSSSHQGELPVLEVQRLLPEHQPQNGEFGLRLSHSISALALDWAVSFYQGFEKLPVMNARVVLDEQVQPPQPLGLVLEQYFGRLWMAGADLAKAWGPVVVKAEAALKMTRDRAGDDPLVRNWRLEAVAGADCSLGDDWSLGMQTIATFWFSYDRTSERAAWQQDGGAAPPFLHGDDEISLSLKLRGQLSDHLGLQFIAIHSLSYHDFFLLGFLHWEPADAVRLVLGGVGFFGLEDNTPYASQEGNSRLFAEVKYSF
ncbi:MAG: hypothetical protein DRI34_08910 [Deltaproteobacteria bacterium]|nr:MAG: hypothetical protein DRI34_08910 [Deltaproteobacteria bacterium]